MASIFLGFPYEWDSSNPEYRVAFKRAVNDLHHELKIAKDIPTPLPIMIHVRELIEEADIAFFDITGLNSNVLIECGVGLASDTKCFLIANRILHQKAERGIWGARQSFIETPVDLKAYNLELYDDTAHLRALIQGTIKHHLHNETATEAKRARIKEAIRKMQPINMSGMATNAGLPLDDVRPVLKGLVALNEVTKLGTGRGTRYRLS